MTGRDERLHGQGRPASGSPGASGHTVDDPIRNDLMELLALQLRFRRHLQEALGVDSAGLDAMIHLAEVGSDTPTALAGTLERSTAATSLVLNRLEASGHISRQPHPQDRRKVVVVPTPASIASAYACANPVITGIDQRTATLTPAERATVAGFLAGLLNVYEDALRESKH
ncbi:MAG: MarR family winged helix-turn-helix transcriptional regulator [Cellulomonas sp.]